MAKEVLLVTGAGQIGLAIVRRMGYGKKIVIATRRPEKAQETLKTLTNAGFDAVVIEMDMAFRESIVNAVKAAQEYGPIKMLVNAAGVSPSQATIEQILQPENIVNTLHSYQLAKRCNEKRVMYEAVEWGKRGARLNDIAPGIIVTPLAVDEFAGIRGNFYKNMFAKCPAGRPGTTDEVADVAELLMSERAQFITGSTFLIDGGATASYYYGPLQPGLETGMEEGRQ